MHRHTPYTHIHDIHKARTKANWPKARKLKTITRRHILDSSKLKEFADENFKFDENGRMLSKWAENTVGIGEIALLLPQCSQKTCFPGASKGVILLEWVKNHYQ